MESLKTLINKDKGGDEVEARHQRCEEMREKALTKCTWLCVCLHWMRNALLVESID